MPLRISRASPEPAASLIFRRQDHTGLDINAFEMLTVKGGKFVKYEDK